MLGTLRTRRTNRDQPGTCRIRSLGSSGARRACLLPSEPGQISPTLPRPGTKEAADNYLRHIYAVYLAIRGCSEAARPFEKPEFLPSVTLEEARRAMRQIDLAAKEAGPDVDGIWACVGPVRLVTAEALKTDRRTSFGCVGRSRLGKALSPARHRLVTRI